MCANKKGGPRWARLRIVFGLLAFLFSLGWRVKRRLVKGMLEGCEVLARLEAVKLLGLLLELILVVVGGLD